jgi:hypothetical protein
MGIDLQSETRILVGRLCAPSDPDRPWWWQCATTVTGNEITVAGMAATEGDALLAAAGTALQMRLTAGPGGEPDKTDMGAVGDDGQVFGG